MIKKTTPVITLALLTLLSPLPATAAGANADEMWNRLDDVLFRAGETADVAAAKRIADYARAHHLADAFHKDALNTVDACAAAGKPESSKAEQQAILSDPRIGQSWTGTTNMKLAEGFANGWGVKPDIKRATAYACHANDVPAELMAQVEALQTHSFTAKAPFVACSYVTSGMNSGFCAGFAADLADRAREKQITALTADYSAAEMQAFANLRKAATHYFEAHARNEQDLTGSMRGVFISEALTAKKDAFLKDLQAYENGSLLRSTPGKYADADKRLNAQYRKIMRHTFGPEALPGSVTKDGIRQTERAWLVYRDAWLTFDKIRHPKTSRDALKIWLARQRENELQTQVAEELP